ncbi:TetR/AcrR family transcriptional regulator [Rhodospirillum sp. A1_3_36]|uniref:TetR/AcrR family transcriptional regulator n=1 Tax=Rhodospirillum sp. A1_3_36 TaxID=3391666 RepID=UPI0039A43CDC
MKQAVSENSTGKGRIRLENEQRILRAAEAVFADAGFAGTTMADIAATADLPKANLHYYFGSKEDLYRALLRDILDVWLDPIESIRAEADPAEAVTAYVAAKMEATRTRPAASRVFANEVLHGAPVLADFLAHDLRDLVNAKAAVLEDWARRGLIAPVDARHFLFMIWALTQHYADFDVQIRLVLGRRTLGRSDYNHITAEVTRFVLRGLGLPIPSHLQ